MTDAYAQTVFVGAFSPSLIYANMYSGGGFVSYSGATRLTIHCMGSCLLSTTGEYSNTEYTAIPASVTSSNQTFDAGVFNAYYLGSSGSISNATYIVGGPDGNSAQLKALSSGTTACVEGEFETGGPLVNGTIAIYGYSSTSSSNVTVSVSSSGGSCTSGSGWTTVHTGIWNSSTPQWIPVGSVSKITFIRIVATYAGSGTGGADIYVDSVSAFMGSYAQTVTGFSPSGVTNSSYIIGIPDSHYAHLTAMTNGSSAWIETGLGTEYSGRLLVRGYSATTTFIVVQYSSDGTHWTTACDGNLNPSSATWVDCGMISQASYIMITVYYEGSTAANLYIDGLYLS
jgi:hypothetical protein